MTYFTNNLTREEDEIRAELERQNARWGEQNHPDGTGPNLVWAFTGPAAYVAESARKSCEAAFAEGHGTWENILTEEIAEAYAEKDPERLLAELLQVEAVIRQWRLAIRRRPSQVDPEPASLAERLREAEAERNAFQDAFIRLQSVVEDGSPEAIATVMRDTAYLTAERSVMADPAEPVVPVRIDSLFGLIGQQDICVSHPDWNDGKPVLLTELHRTADGLVPVTYGLPETRCYIRTRVPADTLVTPVGGA